MRRFFQNFLPTVLVSSHILGELEKIATHYGILRGGSMLREMTAEELDADCPTYVSLRTAQVQRTKELLLCKYIHVTETEDGQLRVYDQVQPEELVADLYQKGSRCARSPQRKSVWKNTIWI